MLVHKFIDQNSSNTMLTAKRSAGVTPKVNLRMPLHEYASKRLHTGFETKGKYIIKSKTGVSEAP